MREIGRTEEEAQTRREELETEMIIFIAFFLISFSFFLFFYFIFNLLVFSSFFSLTAPPLNIQPPFFFITCPRKGKTLF